MTKPFKFIEYNASELQHAGERLIEKLLAGYTQTIEPPTEAWTELILDWFAHSAGTFSGNPVLVDARRRETTYIPHIAKLISHGF